MIFATGRTSAGVLSSRMDVSFAKIRALRAGFYNVRIAKAIVAALDEERGVMTLDFLQI